MIVLFLVTTGQKRSFNNFGKERRVRNKMHELLSWSKWPKLGQGIVWPLENLGKKSSCVGDLRLFFGREAENGRNV